MITIKDVAKKAGVSAGTVSKVLKGYTNISDETKAIVLEAVRELGYIPNSAASTLSSKGKRKIAIYICINDKFQQIDEINMLYLMGALDKCRQLEVESITVYKEALERIEHDDYQMYFNSLSADSVVVFGLNKDDEKIHRLLENRNFKFVVVDAPIVRDNISCVLIDHKQAQYDVAEKIVAEGDRVVYLSGKKNGYVTDMRLRGIKELQKDKGFDLEIIEGDFSEQKAYEETLKFAYRCDAVVCASDLMAIGVKNACKDLGVDLKISGFDGIRLMGYVGNRIITVKQNFYEIGARTIEEIIRLRQEETGREVIEPYEIGRISYQSVIK